MFEEFDDLFNNLFNQRKRKNLESLREFMDKFKFNNEDDLNNTEPTTKRLYKKNGFTFQESVWENELGRIVKVQLVSTPFDEVKTELSLEEKLKLAVKEERYEDAAKLRDEIKNKTTDNQPVEEKDNWNF